MAWFVVLLFLDPQVDFLTVNRNLFRCVNANTHLISFDAEHGHGDFAITNNQAFCAPTSQNQHTFLLTHFISGTTVCKKKALDLQPENDRSPTCLSIDQREQKNSSWVAPFKKDKGRGQTAPFGKRITRLFGPVRPVRKLCAERAQPVPDTSLRSQRRL